MPEARYSSLLFSTQEYQEIGPFRFPVYNDLLPGEARAIEKVNRDNAKASFQTLKLAKAIAKKRGIKPSEAIQLLGELGNAEESDLVFEFADELEDNQRNGVSLVQQQADTVTAFMKFRGEVCFPDAPGEWVKTSDWTSADTDVMPTKLMEEVYNFISSERDGKSEAGNAKAKTPKES
jgi:hypothetical protein